LFPGSSQNWREEEGKGGKGDREKLGRREEEREIEEGKR